MKNVGIFLKSSLMKDGKGILRIVNNLIWRRIEVVITSLTRNQVAGELVREFESHRLRQESKFKIDSLLDLF